MKSISDMNLAEVTLAILGAAVNIPDGMYARAQYLSKQEMRALLDKQDTPYTPRGAWSFEHIDGGDIVIRNGKDWTLIKRGDGLIYEQFLYRFCEEQMKPAAHNQGVPPLISTLHEKGELIAAQATIEQQAKFIELLKTGRQGDPVATIKEIIEHPQTVINNRLRTRALEIIISGAEQPAPVALTVWYGSMPESNGKTNWTAILHRKGGEDSLIGSLSDGITIDRSEYPDRVRYEADRMRYLIGDLAVEPDILDYDDKLHSGYVYPHEPAPVAVVMPERESFEIDDWAGSFCQEALSFGINQDVFARCVRTAIDRTLAEVARLNGVNKPKDQKGE